MKTSQAMEFPKGTVTIPAAEFRQGLTAFVGRVQHGGQRVVVTSHGTEACALVPIEDLRRLRRLELAVAKAKRSKSKMVPVDGPLFSAELD